MITDRNTCAVRGDEDFHETDEVLRDMLLQNLCKGRLSTGVTDEDAKLGGLEQLLPPGKSATPILTTRRRQSAGGRLISNCDNQVENVSAHW
jgi:hypothetical protein